MIGTAGAARITTARWLPRLPWARASAVRWDLWSLALLVVAGASVRTLLGLSRRTLVYFPDEYLYSTLGRSVAATGLPHVRGGAANLPTLLAPYLMAPPWLIHDPQIAYRAALGWASLWFSLAAIPAWALARRVGASSRGALLVAVTAILLPEGVFTTMVLSEPFAYPLFLLTALLAVRTLAEPTGRRQLLLVASMTALLLVRFQFVVIPCVYVLAAAYHVRFRVRELARAQWVVVSSVGLGAVVAAAVGLSRISGAYSALDAYRPSWGLVPWSLADLFVVLLAVGWVVAPGAVAGLRELHRSGGPGRGFVAYVLLATGALVLEAAVFGEREGLVLERYAFYVAPLLVVGFVCCSDAARARAAWGYLLAVGALLLPLLTAYATAGADQAPTLLGLDALTGGSAAARAFAAACCAIAVALVALGVVSRRATVVLAVASMLVLTIASTWRMLAVRHDPASAGIRAREVRTYPAPTGSALLVVRTTPPTAVMNTLFWNPKVTRVLVLGGGHSPDGFRSAAVPLSPRGAAGGPFVLAPDGTAFDAGGGVSAAVFRRLPPVLLFGWDRDDDYLDTTSFLFAVARHDPLRVLLRLTSGNGSKSVSFACGDLRRVVAVGRRPVDVAIEVPPRSDRSCRIDLVRGDVEQRGARAVGVRAAIRVSRGSPGAVAAGVS